MIVPLKDYFHIQVFLDVLKNHRLIYLVKVKFISDQIRLKYAHQGPF